MHVADTNPYPWPYDGDVSGPRLALLICGAQAGLMDASTDAAAVHERLLALAGSVRSVGGHVIWLRHGGRGASPRPAGSPPTRGTPAWQLVTEPATDDEVVDSHGWDGCYGSDLDHTLRWIGAARYTGPPVVLLGGYASEITVDSTVRTLNDRGHECLVLTDGCAPLDAALGARAHHSLTMSGGIFGALGTTAAVTAMCARLPTIVSIKEPVP